MKKKFILLSLMIAAAFTASATITKTIGDPSKVAGTYDYTSLHAASLDLYTTPLTDDCIWLICTDLDETINAGITNNTEHSLIIRPNADEERTITYSTTADNVGPSGNIILGGIPESTQATNIKWVARPTNNVTIDGFAEGGSLHRMKIIGSDAGGRTIALYGAVTNAAIKNCVIDAPRVRTNSTATYAMEIRVEQLAGGTPSAANKTDNTPTGTLIENCQLSVLQSKNAQTIVFNGANSKTAAGKPQNTTIRNCEIISNLRGVFFNGANDVNIEGCTFRLPSASPGYLAHGIMGNSQSGIINVKGCKFLELKTNNVSAGDYGIQGITASGGATVWNIENNIFTGLDALMEGAATKAIKLCAVRCGDSCAVRHNTFVMPVLTYKPTTELMSATPISLLYLAGTKKHFAENNIFVSHETEANNSLIRGGLNENCGRNVFYHDGGNAAIVAGAAVCEDMNKVRASYPTQAATSKWLNVAFDANMALIGNSIDNVILSVPAIAEVATDINGATRHNPTYAGAEEASVLPTISAIYMVGGNNAWNPTIGTQLDEISAGVYQGEFTFEETKYFAFVTALEASADAWTALNSHRFASEIADQDVTNATVNMVYGIDRSMQLPRGKFRITVNTNGMYINVLQICDNLYEFGDNQGTWHANVGEPMTKISENVFEGDFTFTNPINYFAFASEMANDDNTDAWTWLNNTVRFAGAESVVRLDDASEVAVAKGDHSFTILPGVYHFVVDMNLMKITVTQSVAKVIVGQEGYATYYNSAKAYVMPTGMNGYVFNIPAGLGEIAYAAGETVEAGRALVLKAAAGTYDLVFTDPVAPKDLATQLHGSDAAGMTDVILPGSYVYYGLSLDAAPNDTPESVGFYYMVADGAAFENGAHKAFLAIPTSTEAPERILFHNNDATNIENVEGMDQAVKFIENGQMFIKKNGVVYDMMGHAVK